MQKRVTAAELYALAEQYKMRIKPHEASAFVLALQGDLGAGKTTFTKALAQSFGVTETVTSPTFVIEKIYKITHPEFDHFIHIDAYRIERSEELAKLGWNAIVNNPRNLIVIEWPERVADLIPADAETLRFTFVSDTLRNIETDHGKEI